MASSRSIPINVANLICSVVPFSIIAQPFIITAGDRDGPKGGKTWKQNVASRTSPLFGVSGARSGQRSACAARSFDNQRPLAIGGLVDFCIILRLSLFADACRGPEGGPTHPTL